MTDIDLTCAVEPPCTVTPPSLYGGQPESNFTVSVTPDPATASWSAHSPVPWVEFPGCAFPLTGPQTVPVRIILNEEGFRETTITFGTTPVVVKQEGVATPVPGPEPPSGNVIRVKPGDDLQAAVNALAETGGTILAAVGRYDRARILAPVRVNPAAPPIVFTSDTENLPSEGERITDDYESGIAMFHNTDGQESMFEAPNKSSGVHFVGVGFGPLLYDRAMAAIGNDRQHMPTVSDRPFNFRFDRVLFRGDPTNGQHQAVRVNGKDIAIVGCWVKDCFEHGRDSQAIGGWNGTEAITIDNNHLEGGAENIMFGGADAASPEMQPRNVTVTRNHILKNFAWMSLERQPAIKALFELKSLKGCLVEGNLIENNWARDWPDGLVMTIKSANQEGTETWACSEDIIIRNNYIRNVGAFFTLVGKNDGGKESAWCRRISVVNNVVLGMNEGNWRGTGRAYALNNPCEDLSIEHNTVLGSYGDKFVGLTKSDNLPYAGKNFRFLENVNAEGEYGIHSSVGMGTPALDTHFPGGYQYRNNATRDDAFRVIPYPEGNALIAPADWAACFDASGRVIPGSPLAVVQPGAGANLDAILGAMADTP